MNFITYFKYQTGDFRTYNYASQHYETVSYVPLKANTFCMSGKQYKANDDDLKQYANDTYLQAEALSKSSLFKYKKNPFHYTTEHKYPDGKVNYRSHDANVESFFVMMLRMTDPLFLDSIKDNHIRRTEANWMRKCSNGGLIYSVRGEYQSYGRDFSNFYGTQLSANYFKFPTQEGKEVKLAKLPNKMVKMGYYHVKITCDDPNIRKVFAFSKEDVYTSISVKHAKDLQTHFPTLTIELVQDVEHNAYIFTEGIVSGDKIFKKWHEAILQFKKECPEAKPLIKKLSSTLWGTLSRKNFIYRTTKEVQEQKLYFGLDDDCDYYNEGYYFNEDMSGYYKLHDLNQPYKHTLGRVKCFITAQGRKEIGNIALRHIDDVIRVYCDNICFTKPYEFPDLPTFIEEQKTSGLLKFPIRRVVEQDEE